MARGVGGFASGLSRGIRTGMEMRQFKREEDEYNYQKDQRETHKRLSGAIPTAEELNAVQPMQDMNVDGFSVPADTFTGGQEQYASGQARLNEITRDARAQLDPDKATQLLSQVYSARTQAFTLAANSYFSAKAPEDKLQSLQLAYQYLGFDPEDAPFSIGEDGSITHAIEGLQDADGNPLPIEAVLSMAATQLSENPAALFPLMDERMRQQEAETIARDERKKAENHRIFLREQEAAQTRATERSALIAEEMRVMQLEFLKARENADLAMSELQLANFHARATGQRPEDVRAAYTRLDKNWEPVFAEITQDPVYGEFAVNNPEAIRRQAATILAANPNVEDTEAAMAAAVRVAALLDGYELTEEQMKDPRNTFVLQKMGGGFAWIDPLTNEPLMMPDALIAPILSRAGSELGGAEESEVPSVTETALPVDTGNTITTRGQRKQTSPTPTGFELDWEAEPVAGSNANPRRGGYRDRRAVPDLVEDPFISDVEDERYGRAYR